ncbi:DUF4345 family protein [Hellea balneolensis]|uniref:DUF4345 family protein n=1 Tax=Hellea balneolensis TaxID=287478 RepID=UPI0003FEE137|nr:DUF4345 family protein [Hellea balneolensis]
MIKIFNGLNGVFYVLFGLYGLFLPQRMAAFMGMELSLLGLHQMRAISCVMAALGALLCLYIYERKDQRQITLAIIFVTLAFMTGRFLGLLLDGTGPVQTYKEIGIEFVVVALGTIFYRRG